MCTRHFCLCASIVGVLFDSILQVPSCPLRFSLPTTVLVVSVTLNPWFTTVEMDSTGDSETPVKPIYPGLRPQFNTNLTRQLEDLTEIKNKIK